MNVFEKMYEDNFKKENKKYNALRAQALIEMFTNFYTTGVVKTGFEPLNTIELFNMLNKKADVVNKQYAVYKDSNPENREKNLETMITNLDSTVANLNDFSNIIAEVQNRFLKQLKAPSVHVKQFNNADALMQTVFLPDKTNDRVFTQFNLEQVKKIDFSVIAHECKHIEQYYGLHKLIKGLPISEDEKVMSVHVMLRGIYNQFISMRNYLTDIAEIDANLYAFNAARKIAEKENEPKFLGKQIFADYFCQTLLLSPNYETNKAFKYIRKNFNKQRYNFLSLDVPENIKEVVKSVDIDAYLKKLYARLQEAYNLQIKLINSADKKIKNKYLTKLGEINYEITEDNGYVFKTKKHKNKYKKEKKFKKFIKEENEL